MASERIDIKPEAEGNDVKTFENKTEKDNAGGNDQSGGLETKTPGLFEHALAFDAEQFKKCLSTGSYDVNASDDVGRGVLDAMLCEFLNLDLKDRILKKPQLIEILDSLMRSGFDINMQNRKHLQTALHVVTSAGNFPDVIKPLLACGCKVNILDRKSNSALHVAILSGFEANAKTLIEGGSDVNLGDARGATPLHMLCRGHLNIYHLKFQ